LANILFTYDLHFRWKEDARNGDLIEAFWGLETQGQVEKIRRRN